MILLDLCAEQLEAALEAKKTAVDAVSASIIRLADAERGAASESAVRSLLSGFVLSDGSERSI